MLASLYNVTRGTYERTILYSNPSYSGNNCRRANEHGKGDPMVVMTSELANILGSIGANVKYPHDAQTPDRLQGTRQRASEVSKVPVQSVQDYKDQYRKMIHDLLKD